MIRVIAGASGIVVTPPGGGQRAEVDSGDPQVSSHTISNNGGIHVSACEIDTIISGGGKITNEDGDTQAQGLDVEVAPPRAGPDVGVSQRPCVRSK